ncbi:MAG: hypothetical protein Q7J34_00700 [Bacteroidales bacterium]|nr:hypothetical protein [Bacteroidales bacterium]
MPRVIEWSIEWSDTNNARFDTFFLSFRTFTYRASAEEGSTPGILLLQNFPCNHTARL